jgi:hypothetical protein
VRVYYATQTDVGPPTIVLFVNDPAMVSESYQRFMINRFRELLPYGEVPIKLLLRGRVKGQDEEIAGGGDDNRPRGRGAALSSKRKSARAKGGKAGGAKPHPKKAPSRGPARGTRPK